MEPFFLIEANGKNVTDRINEFLVELEITDEAEDKSDSVSLTLDDRPRGDDNATLEIPLIGTEIDITIGYVGGQSRKVGKYLIDEISVNNAPRSLNVTGRAAGMNTQYRTPKSQSYHQRTLGAIMGEIAARNGYEAKIDPELSNIIVRHIDQTNESDMAFAARLANEYDAAAKPMDKKLVIAKRGTGKAISGANLPEIVINEADCSNWKFQLSARNEAGVGSGIKGTGDKSQQAAAESRAPESAREGQGVIHTPAASAETPHSPPASAAPAADKNREGKGGVRAWWTDIRTGERKAVTVGEEPFEEMRYTYHNEAEAQAAISTRINKSGRGKASLSLSMPGSPLAQAEAKLILSPPFRAYIPAKWRAKSVKHKISRSGGFTTSISAELFDDKQQNAAGNVGKTKPSEDDRVDDDAPKGATDEGTIHTPKADKK